MKLWRIYSKMEYPSYDCLQVIVVRAETEGDARFLAASECGDEGPAVWADPNESTCEEIPQEGQVEVICVDFYAG